MDTTQDNNPGTPPRQFAHLETRTHTDTEYANWVAAVVDTLDPIGTSVTEADRNGQRAWRSEARAWAAYRG
jgi:anti-sigma-K factor RskA